MSKSLCREVVVVEPVMTLSEEGNDNFDTHFCNLKFRLDAHLA